jgi:hypothetical protein
LEGFTPYRRATVDWTSFERDSAGARRTRASTGRPSAGAGAVFETAQLSSDWDSLKEADAELLINSLSILCPFDPEERQALLEAPTLANRRRTLVTLMEFALRSGATKGPCSERGRGRLFVRRADRPPRAGVPGLPGDARAAQSTTRSGRSSSRRERSSPFPIHDGVPVMLADEARKLD